MLIYLKLFWTFFKIGMFSFGGGYAMIPLIQKEIEINGWIDPVEFADIVAVSQMTPGPLAVNAATYVGVKVAGVLGSTFATIGVSLPSFILIILIARFFLKFRESIVVDSVLKGIRPVTVGLIGSAVFFLAGLSIFQVNLSPDSLGHLLSGRFGAFFEDFSLNPGSLLIFLIILVAMKKFKVHPIMAIVLSAVLGIILV